MAKILNKILLYRFNKKDKLIFYKELAISKVTDSIALQLANQTLFIKSQGKLLNPEQTANLLLNNSHKLSLEIQEYLKYYL